VFDLICKFNGKAILSGIPVRNAFLNQPIVNEEQNKNEYEIINAGFLGCRSIKDIIENLLKNRKNRKIKVLIGKNRKLKYHILKLYPDLQVIQTYSSEYLAYLYANAKVIYTKPGGIVISELIASKQLNICFFANHGGQEDDNLDYCLKHRIGYEVNSEKIAFPNLNKLKQMRYLLRSSTHTIINSILEISSLKDIS